MCVADLYQAHRGPLVHLAMRYVRDRATAEDVVHEAFARFMTAELRDPSKAAAYLRASTINGAHDVLRRLATVKDWEPPEAGTEVSAEHLALARLDRKIVLRALDRLPRQQRAVYLLRFYADLSEAQIAEALSVTRGAVKSHVRRGRRALAAQSPLAELAGRTAATRPDTPGDTP